MGVWRTYAHENDRGRYRNRNSGSEADRDSDTDSDPRFQSRVSVLLVLSSKQAASCRALTRQQHPLRPVIRPCPHDRSPLPFENLLRCRSQPVKGGPLSGWYARRAFFNHSATPSSWVRIHRVTEISVPSAWKCIFASRSIFVAYASCSLQFFANHETFTSPSTALHSRSPVTRSALCFLASAAAKASARLKLKRDFRSAAKSASSRSAE